MTRRQLIAIKAVRASLIARNPVENGYARNLCSHIERTAAFCLREFRIFVSYRNDAILASEFLRNWQIRVLPILFKMPRIKCRTQKRVHCKLSWQDTPNRSPDLGELRTE